MEWSLNDREKQSLKLHENCDSKAIRQPTHRRPMIKFKLAKITMQPRKRHLLLGSRWMGGKVVFDGE